MYNVVHRFLTGILFQIWGLVLELKAILSNAPLIAGIGSWMVAQILKTIIFFIMNGYVDFSRLVGDGGMPSGHSATVTALATSCAIRYGFDSSAFAVSAVLAVVVMHDAMGVRLESGKHAKAINELVDLLDADVLPEVKLKEFLGHTPTQVVAGTIIGLIIGMAVTTALV